jgi:hypothetical protein
MQPTYYNRPYSPPPPPRAANVNPYSYGSGNINFNGIGQNITQQIEKLSNLLKARGIKALSSSPLSPPPPTKMNYDYDGDGALVKYTRKEFDDLYKTNIKRSSHMEMGGNEGYFDRFFFMFQLYIAFINALMNATNMSASIIFGNRSLQNVFSIFLVNVLNMTLKTNVSELTPEQLRDLLEKNRPILQQISKIIIDEASQLLVGLSNVVSKIAMDWVQNVLPGLVKSAAVGVPSAIEAGIPPLGELVEIINTGMALMASFMKVVGGVQRNMDTVSEGYSHVKNAYSSLQKIKDLLGMDPAEIVKTATSAVVTPTLNNAAQNFLKSVSEMSTNLSPETDTQPEAAPIVSAAPVTSLTNDVKEVYNKAKNAGINAMKNVAKQGLNRVSTAISNLVTPSGTTVTDSNGQPVTTSFWNRSWKGLFDTAIKKLKESKETMDKIRLSTGNDKNGRPLPSTVIMEYVVKHPDILIPFLPVPYNVAAIAFRLIQTYIQRIGEQKAAAIPATSGGGGCGGGGCGGGLTRMKSRKYLKNTKHFNRYISNLRKKTAKKEQELINSIQELKSI